MRKKPYGIAAGVRAQASQLPNLMGLRQQREFQDKQIEQGEAGLALSEKRLGMEQSQFKKKMQMEKEAQGIAAGGMFLKGGLAVGKAAHSYGMFDKAGSQLKSGASALWDRVSGKQQIAGGVDYSPQAADNPLQAGGPSESYKPSALESFKSGGWKSGAWGGASAGLAGAGAAKMLGAKKKWQTGLAGAGAGLLGTFMAGGSDPFSFALGGALGGGLGMLL
jgi:hypothetical protein